MSFGGTDVLQRKLAHFDREVNGHNEEGGQRGRPAA